MMHSQTIIVLDFGSQYTQLIARRIRELGVYSEIKPFHASIDDIKSLNPKGIILSGGPSSVYDEDAPLPAGDIFSLGCPVLGICYGLQIIAYLLGGRVDEAQRREYGRAPIQIDDAGEPAEVIGIPQGRHLRRDELRLGRGQPPARGLEDLVGPQGGPLAGDLHADLPHAAAPREEFAAAAGIEGVPLPFHHGAVVQDGEDARLPRHALVDHRNLADREGQAVQ